MRTVVRSKLLMGALVVFAREVMFPAGTNDASTRGASTPSGGWSCTKCDDRVLSEILGKNLPMAC